MLPVHYSPDFLGRTERSADELHPESLYFTLFLIKLIYVPVAQRIEQSRPKGKMAVQFHPGILMKRTDYLKIFLLRTIGNFLLFSALSGVILTFAPVIQAEITYRYNQARGQRYFVADVKTAAPNIPGPNLLAIGNEPSPLPISPLDTDFGLVVPKIAANARVIANVDPGSESEYFAALKEGVAHAKGTAFPGEIGNSYLFAHSVGNFWEVNRWNAVFYLLRELQPGDEIDVFYHGSRYLYRVYDKKVVAPTDTGYLYTQPSFPMLTLQTCWPPGTTLERLLVFARLAN